MRAALAFVLMVLASAAQATQDQWPALFSVMDVSSDDVLNIRAEPSASAVIVGTLAADATDVEVILPNPRHTWGLVNVGERTGWISLRFLRRQPGQWAGTFPEVRTCSGTEPFWTVTRGTDRSLGWTTPDTRATGSVIETWSSANRRDRHAMTGRLATPDGPSEVFAVLSLQSCRDGMSDRLYGVAVDLLFGSMDGADMFSGCCSLTPQP